jgi:signal transduction histidine kinase
MTIKDNGRGIDTGNGLDNEGQGLRSMTRRASALGGDLRIDSGKNRGTSIDLELPAARTAGV